MLIYTDVLIWFFKGNKHAQEVIHQYDKFDMSVVTYMELIQGMRNKIELNQFRRFLNSKHVNVIYIDKEISTKAMFLVESYHLSHSLRLADSLIAATSLKYGYSIVTGNDKDYRFITDILIEKFRP